MKLEELVPGIRARGLTAQPVEIVRAEWLGSDYLHVTYRDAGGATAELLMDREMEAGLAVDRPAGSVSTPEDVRGWKLGVEAMRIRYAGLIDPMLAVSSSSLRPLPHQIKAVYGELLPRTPLRYLLADDPGAGKTIMCGLYVKELMLRGDLERCLIVAPGGLVDQWVDELWDKFRLQFRVLTRDLIDTTVGVSVFDDNPRLIARMDMLSRNEELQALLEKSEWDLVVVDEAHRMSARFAGREMETTKRYGLGRLLGSVTRNLLLMTATPHSGDPAAFQAFLALLDQDRFSGKSAGSAVAGTDVMRRMLKEELLTMDGKPLFPERRASTVRYTLSQAEQALYEAVSDYVRHEMNRAERLRRAGDSRGHTVGFALTVLQRRLASSPEAILRTLQRRRDRLGAHSIELLEQGRSVPSQVPELSKVSVPLNPETAEADRELAEIEGAEDGLADAASAATTLGELAVEIEALERLVGLADEVRSGAQDSKWLQLRSILEDDVLTRDESGAPRKIIIFSEHRDTLRYLVERIRALPGRDASVVEIHGGLSRSQRLEVQRQFRLDAGTTVLVATDAAGEGLNLQCAHLMVNYDLPWNPNRIEQRFGRIHRIGQTEVCHLWNLVADGTREGDVFLRLLDKMQEQAKAYQGKVFDVLGEAFEGAPLRDLLVQAVRYGDDPDVRKHLDTVIDDRIGRGIPELVERRALYTEVLQGVDLDQARDRVDVGHRSRLQPHFASSWFESSLKDLGGRARRRADGLVEVGYIPDEVRASARERLGVPVRARYDAVSLDPEQNGGEVDPNVEVVSAGHPLLEALAEVAEQRVHPLLRDGVVLVDDSDQGREPRVFAALMHEVVDGHPRPHSLSRRVALVEVGADGSAREVGPVYLDYRAPRDEELGRVAAIRDAVGDSTDELGKAAIEWAMRHLVPEHVTAIRDTHAVAVGRATTEVSERLGKEISYWRSKVHGAQPHDRVGSAASRRVQEAEARLAKRLRDLQADAQVVPRPARVLACALVVPAHLLTEHPGAAPDEGEDSVLGRAKQLVEEAESALGHAVHPETMHTRSTIRSMLPDGLSRWIDVHVEPAAGRSVSISRTQLMHARNLGERYRLALVRPADDVEGGHVRYVQDPFRRVREGDLDQHSFQVAWSTLWRWAEDPS